MNLEIRGIGLWGPGLYSWNDFLTSRNSDFDNLAESTPVPSAKSIPARERRRAPLPVKLAIETIGQACAMAEVEPGTVATVFSSAMGDNEITDYICRALTGPERFLSPTKFHNSVHNAPSGYWSIAAHNRAPSGYVGGFEDSFPIGLLEAATLCIAEKRPVVLAIYDVPTVAPLNDICRIEDSFGAAFVLDSDSHSNAWSIEICCREGKSTRPKMHSTVLQNICERNPAAQSLALLEAIAKDDPAVLCWPTGNATHLELSLKN
jgi:hypothetical protein